VLSVGLTDGLNEVPEHWRPWLHDVDIDWVDERAKCLQLYQLASPTADLSIICDADTILVNPLPDDFLQDAVRRPAISAVLAHYPPPITNRDGTSNRQVTSVEELWDALGSRLLGRPLERPYRYTLLDDDSARAPFYVNHGFIAAPAKLMRQMGSLVGAMLNEVTGIVDNDFCYQIAVACAVEGGHLPHESLPIRFNFPNDPLCDQRYAEELARVVVVHYLRTELFDRHKILADARDFEAFMTAALDGSNRTFRDHVRHLTDGVFPFTRTASPPL
jgi:hypothetical protein